MVRSSGFGSTTCYYSAHFRLAFASAPVLHTLTSQHIVTRRPVLQKVRDHTGIATVVLSLLVSLWFQVLFHSPSGVLFTFPSRYCFSIGHQVVFSLRRWASRVPTEFLVLDGTLDTHYIKLSFDYADFTLFVGTFQCSSSTSSNTFRESEPLTYFYMRFRLLPFRSPLLR